MPTPTYTPLANITLGSTAASVTFSSISQAYRDLVLVFVAGPTGGNAPRMRLNGDTGANYFYVTMEGNGGDTATAGITQDHMAFNQNYPIVAYGGSPMSQFTVNLMDYSASDKHKSVLTRSNYSAGAVNAIAGRWGSTSPITSIVIYPGASTWVAGSSFALYGIAA